MCEDCHRQQDEVRWLALLARRVALMVVNEIERRYDLPRSVLTKREREEREQKAA